MNVLCVTYVVFLLSSVLNAKKVSKSGTSNVGRKRLKIFSKIQKSLSEESLNKAATGCRQCTHVYTSSVPSLLQDIVSSLQNPQCASRGGGELFHCPKNPASGKLYRCITYEGNLTLQLGVNGRSFPASAHVVERDCELFETEIPLNCKKEQEVDLGEPKKENIRNILLRNVTVTSAKYTGTTCLQAQSGQPRSAERNLSIFSFALTIMMLSLQNMFEGIYLVVFL
ncbi:uncharacterized protein LOC133176046 [Saccostrea echinata]|uniref:uncharacterized protein LOC133176046 n=1 Tax=Saccostrea echinata TaxID=191078 RepID=UPI002A83AB15|nr:uncharacterized protein LOC133176046 [Saccostrea echinata]